VVITDSSQLSSSAEDSGDDSDMSTVVPDNHTVDDAPQDVVAGDAGDAGDDQLTSACAAPSVGAKTKKKKKNKKKIKKNELDEDATTTIIEEMTDMQLGPEQRPKPNRRMLLSTETPAVIGAPPKTQYGTISVIDPANGVNWRPGNYLHDREPTAGFYVDGEIVQRVTGIKPEQDVSPTSGSVSLLSEKAHGKQKVDICHSLFYTEINLNCRHPQA
jgi:hypothetical protein